MERLTKTFQKAGEKFACLPECEVECVYGWAKENSGCRCDKFAKILNRLSAIEDILGDDYDLDRLKELLEKDRNGAFDPYSKFPQKGQEVWYWDSENGISRGIVDFVNIDFCDNSLNEFGVDFPDENDFDVFNGSAWGTCIVDSMEAAHEKVNGEQR